MARPVPSRGKMAPRKLILLAIWLAYLGVVDAELCSGDCEVRARAERVKPAGRVPFNKLRAAGDGGGASRND